MTQSLSDSEENRQRTISHQPLQELRKPMVSEHFYHDIFVTEFNIYFGFPRTDTCDTCDSLNIKINEATEESEQTRLKKELEAHQILAKSGFKRLDASAHSKLIIGKVLVGQQPLHMERNYHLSSLARIRVWLTRDIVTDIVYNFLQDQKQANPFKDGVPGGKDFCEDGPN